MYAGANLAIYFQDLSKPPMPPQEPLVTFNVREMAQGEDAYQAKLDWKCMIPLRDHQVFAANINRSKSKNHPHGQEGIFPGSYLAFAKRGSAWELVKNHDRFVRLGFSIKVVGEVAAK